MDWDIVIMIGGLAFVFVVGFIIVLDLERRRNE
jgi:Na+-transporting methylmalonyl-CoA/oxaloacetate decarboxylase gamma subunit